MQMNRTTTQLARPQTFQVQNNSKCGTRYRRDPAGRYLDSLRRDPVLFDWINSFEIISCSNGLVSSSTAVAPLPEQNLLSDCLSPDPFNLSPKLRLRMNAESGGLADPAQRWPPIFLTLVVRWRRKRARGKWMAPINLVHYSRIC